MTLFYHLRPLLSLCVALLWLAATPTHAEDAPGLAPARLRLPEGPGSLQGVGEDAELNLNMGAMTYAVPFALPAGYRGFGPTLGLRYSSQSGQGSAGMGWSLGEASIQRMTARGLPDYDADDLFAAPGGTELVRLPGTDTFRARFEGGFVRYQWRGSTGGKAGYWFAEYPDGSVGYFGARADGTPVPEARIEGSGGTSAYYLVERRDPFDHRIEYGYLHDAGRPYLSRIAWAFHGGAPRYEVSLLYDVREDALSDAKSGVEVELRQRLQDVEVRVRGQLLRRYHVEYEPYKRSAGLSRLSAVSTHGTDNGEPHPAVQRFAYTQGLDPTCSSAAVGCARPTLTDLGAVGADFRTGDVALIDMNHDALPDVLDTREGVHRIALRTLTRSAGGSAWLPGQESAAGGRGGMALSRKDVQLLDVNGDGSMDMLDTLDQRVLLGGGKGDWAGSSKPARALPDFAADADLRPWDIDHDGRTDAVHLGRSGAWAYLNHAGDGFSEQAVPLEGLGRGFTQDGLQLADMNGDGMVDVVQPVTGGVHYWLHLGRGSFAPAARELFGLPDTLTANEMQLTDVNGDGLTDVLVVQATELRYALNLSGRSFAPMVTITPDDVGGGLPERDGHVSIQFADMNGNGTRDVVYIDASGRVQFVELFTERPHLLREIDNSLGKVIRIDYGTTVTHMARDGGADAWKHRLPHPLQVVERLSVRDALSGIEQVRALHYRDGYWDGEDKQFRGFAEVELFTAGDDSLDDGHVLHTFDVGDEDRYRHGLALRTETRSDGSTLSHVHQKYRRCKLGQVPERGTAYPIRWLCLARKETTLVEGQAPDQHVTIAESYHYDGYGNLTDKEQHGVVARGGGACQPCSDDTNGACGPDCTGDELVEHAAFVPPGATTTSGRWLVRAPYIKRVYSPAAPELYSEERLFYDGEDFFGMRLGRLERGALTRSEARRSTSNDDYIPTERLRLDPVHGLPLEVRDENGHRTLLEYGPAGLLLNAEVRVFEDPELRDADEFYRLRREVRYHPVLEQVTHASAWMRQVGGATLSPPNETHYDYDVHGRMIAMAKPGDDLERPTESYRYELGSPVSRILSDVRSRAGEAPDLQTVQCFDGLGRAVQTRSRLDDTTFQVSGFVQFNSQGQPQRVYRPYQGTSSACDRAPPTDGVFTQARHDATGRVLSRVHPDEDLFATASEERFAYLPLSVDHFDPSDTDPDSPHANTPQRTVMDGLGRVVRLERLLEAGAAPHVARFGYDALGRLSRATDPLGHTIAQEHDLLGRILRIDHPDSGRTLLRYDDAGQLLARIDARGVEQRHRYDEAGRLLTTWQAGEEATTRISWTYDLPTADCGDYCDGGAGQLVQLSYPLLDGVRGFERTDYDHRGRPVVRRFLRGRQPYRFEDAYDNVGRTVARTFPGGFTLEYAYDGASRLTAVPGFIDALSYAPDGTLSELRYGNGVVTTREHDARQRLTRLRTALPGRDEAELDLRYSLSRTGQLLRTDDLRPPTPKKPSFTATYAYDALHRLTGAHLEPGRGGVLEQTLAYTLDAADRLLTQESSLPGSPAHLGELRYDERRAPPHAPSLVNGHALAYDAQGQLLEDAATGVRHTWDFQGRLVRTENTQGVTVVESAYGAGPRRVQKRDSQRFVEYLTDDFEIRDGIATVYARVGDERHVAIERLDFAAHILPDLVPDGVITVADAWLQHAVRQGYQTLDLPPPQTPWTGTVQAALTAAARRLLASGQTLAPRTYHTDHRGSVAAVTDAQGNLLARHYDYPFGSPRFGEYPSAHYTFTGQERDRGSQLSYHRARHLHTALGLWTKPDPLFESLDPETTLEQPWQALNPYSYVGRDPLGKVDPSGEVGVLLALAGAAVVVLFTPSQEGEANADGGLTETTAAVVGGHIAGKALAPVARVAGRWAGKALGKAAGVVRSGVNAVRNAAGRVAGSAGSRGVSGASRGVSGASSALKGAQLTRHLGQLQQYGKAGFKELQNGRIRYYGEVAKASKPGAMAGRRVVREWNPASNSRRTWMETLDHAGRVRIVRPETGGAKIHYMFDELGSFTGTF